VEAMRHKPFDPKTMPCMDEAVLADLEDVGEALGCDQSLQLVSRDANSSEQKRRAVTPPVLTENMQVNEWAVALLYIEKVHPSQKLVVLLNDNSPGWSKVIVPVLNRAVLRLLQENMDADKPTRHAPVSVEEDGLVVVHGDVTPEKQLCQAAVALYYHAIEAILFCESVRLQDSSDDAASDVSVLVCSAEFHKAVFAGCALCVCHAVGVTHKLRTNSAQMRMDAILQVTESNPYQYLKVSETFIKSLTSDTARGQLGSPLMYGLPSILVKELQKTEMQIIDTLMWTRDKKFEVCLADRIDDFQERTTDKKDSVCLWPPEVLLPMEYEDEDDDSSSTAEALQKEFPSTEDEDYSDYRAISYLLSKILKVAFHRIKALCDFLDVAPHLPVAKQVWVAFRYLLRNHVDLLYERHVDHWILCCLYGVAKTMKYTPELTFTRIIDAYVVVRGQDIGDITCQRIVRHIKLNNETDDTPIGNIITLYNSVFVPRMKKHLLKSKSLLEATKQLEQDKNGEKPEGGIEVSLQSPSAHLKLMQERLGGRNGNATLTLFELGKPQSSRVIAKANEITAAVAEGHDE
jgi:hypothetical protein